MGMRHASGLAGLILAGSALGQAGTPYRVMEFAPRSYVLGYAWGDVGVLAPLGDRCVMVANSGSPVGAELWITDGTMAGTRFLKDVDPRPLMELGLRNPISYTAGGAPRVAMVGRTERGMVVVITDGTPESTRVSSPFAGNSAAMLGAVAGRPLALVATSAGTELWITDGGPDPAGTFRLAMLDASPVNTGPQSMIGEAGGVAYFWATKPGSSRVWRTDGTVAGTYALPGLPASDLSTPRACVLGGRILSAHYQLAAGLRTDVYVTDLATEASTRLTLAGGAQPSQASAILPFPQRGTALLSATGGLWTTDGTDAGTSLLVPGLNQFGLGSGTRFGGLIESPTGPTHVFIGETAQTGAELWASDGTAAGTRLLQDATPGPGSSSFSQLGLAAGGLWYIGSGGQGVRWTDGTPEGTSLLTASFPNTSNGYVPGPYFSAAGGRLFFRPQTGNSYAPGDLAALDASGATTSLRVPSTTAYPYGSAPEGVFHLDGRTTFRATDASLGQYSTDGTSAGTERVASLPEGKHWTAPVRIGGLAWSLVYEYFTNTPVDLWRTDGTGPGTLLIGPSERIADFQTPGPMQAGGDGVLFVTGRMYTSGPTPGSARRLAETQIPTANDFAVDGQGRMYYSLYGASTLKVRRQDPATGVITELAVIGNVTSSGQRFTAWNGRVYFCVAVNSANSLWSTDGTPAGTGPVAGATPLGSGPLVVCGDKLLARRPTVGGRTGFLAVSASGELASVGDFKSITSALPFRGGALMLADDGEHGTEPWFTDGSAAGTRMIAETAPGPFGAWTMISGRSTDLQVSGDLGFFAVTTESEASHPWVTDGTAEGTHRLGRVPDEAAERPLYPSEFAVADGLVLFQGWTPGRGYNLYAVRLCDADFTGDGFLDFFDYLGFAGAFESGTPDADFNGDGFVDFFDYGGFVDTFERGCSSQ